MTAAGGPDASGNGSVLVLGSANMDLLIRVGSLPGPGETVLGSDAVLQPGGKGANQAVAAALAGAGVVFAGCVGDDANGELIRTSLRRAGVDVELLRVEPGRSSGLAVVLVTPDGENAIAVSSGANSALLPASLQELRPAVAQAELLLMQLELPVEVVVRATDLAAEVGTPVLLNLAPAAALPPEVLERIQVLVVNQSEAGFLLGAEPVGLPALRDAARQLAGRGPGAVVVTAGADGAVLADAAGVTHVPAQPVQVVDTSGAGDAFVGVLAAELSRGTTLRDAVGAAGAAAAAAVQVPGAQLVSLPGGPDRDHR